MANQETYGALNIALFGPPGSGKGTQAVMLIDEFGFVHLSPGDLLRKEIQEKTPLGRQAESVMASGALMPDEVIHGIVGNHVGSVLARKGRILLDGFPRTMPQLQFLEKFLEDGGSELHAVFFLDIDKERLIERLTGRRICESCGAVYHVQTLPSRVEGVCDACGGKLVQRKDDNRESIQERLNAYENQTYPILQAFETQGKLFKVSGDQPRESVYGEIARRVRQLLQETTPTRPA